jgi:hypothetical protein
MSLKSSEVVLKTLSLLYLQGYVNNHKKLSETLAGRFRELAVIQFQ